MLLDKEIIQYHQTFLENNTCLFDYKKLGKNFIFHSNLWINPNKFEEVPTIYEHIFIKWRKHFSSLPSLRSFVASQCLWLNKYIKIDDKTTFISPLSTKVINFVGQLFQNNQQIKKTGRTQNGIWFNWKRKIADCSNRSCCP